MSDRKPVGVQIPVVTPLAPQSQQSFDLKRLEIGLSTGLGSDFTHYRAMPSPIGKKDRGDLRRSEGVDTITSNGMIYRCAGQFTATMTDNEREQKLGVSGPLDPSMAYLVMPRFYNKDGGVANGERIYLAPGDRLYFSDPKADVNVPTYHEMDFQPGSDNVPMYPIVRLEEKIVDSQNIEYTENVDFIVTKEGNIRWLDSGNNPGIDPDTGKGRIYSVRYLYKAFYYVWQIPKEVRITNVTQNGVRSPERMPSYPLIVREYIFHNQNRGDSTNQNVSKTPQRAVEATTTSIDPNSPFIPVDMSNFREDDEK